MSLRDELPPEDDEPEYKFDECLSCVNRFRVRTCNACDVGESFKEEEPAGLDDLFREGQAW